ncbi:MAG: futalosine hydrolase [Bacteroidales bacterium]|jgi:futalosine hydrolase|nr:futalosine hydrolase [Bacteroidales bacterium]
MARIVIVFASHLEAQGFEIPPACEHRVEFLVSGVGAYAMQYALHDYCMHHSPEIIVCAGIAGAFSQEYQIGQIVALTSDCFADVGVISGTTFQSIFDMKLAHAEQTPFVHGRLPITCAPLRHSLPQVSGITVNTITASEPMRDLWRKTYNPAVETMEGAAVHYVALRQNLPCLHLRAISNMVGERNKDKWNIPLALENLYNELRNVLIQNLVQ